MSQRQMHSMHHKLLKIGIYYDPALFEKMVSIALNFKNVANIKKPNAPCWYNYK